MIPDPSISARTVVFPIGRDVQGEPFLPFPRSPVACPPAPFFPSLFSPVIDRD